MVNLYPYKPLTKLSLPFIICSANDKSPGCSQDFMCTSIHKGHMIYLFGGKHGHVLETVMKRNIIEGKQMTETIHTPGVACSEMCTGTK